MELDIARPIPMKRELKVTLSPDRAQPAWHRKAHPDEKGTESQLLRR